MGESAMENKSILTNIGDIEVYIGTYGDKWIAATGTAPYLCLEAESNVELHAKLLRAVAFCRKAFAELKKGEREESTPFTLKQKITVRELENA
jgi:hypothetical protein